MKKKITAVLLTIVMTVSMLGTTVCGASGADERVQALVTRLAAYSSEERQSLTNALVPMLITNTGIDALTYYINSYDPSSESLFNRVVGKVLAVTDKETALRMLGYFGTIDEGIREEYLTGFQSRKERTLSASAERSLESFVKRQCALYSGLEEILTEDKITTGVIARLIEAPYKMNNSKPILTDGANGFAIKEPDPMLIETIQTAIASRPNSGFEDASELLELTLEWLNTSFSYESKMLLKSVLGDIGVYQAAPGSVNGSGGVIASDISSPDGADGIGYELIESSIELGYDIVEIYEYANGTKKSYGEFECEQIVAIRVSSPNVMLYKIEQTGLAAVKYSVYADGLLMCRVGASGRYAVKIMSYYFDDVNGWGRDYIESLYNRGVINGKGERTFAPEDSITREEFVKLVVETAGMTYENESTDFVDVEQGQWYEKYVAAAQKHGLINGVGDGRFGIGNNITRQDMSKILCDLLVAEGLIQEVNSNIDMFGDAADIAQYAQKAVGTLMANGIISGDENGNFNPESNATRQEAAKLIYKMFELYVTR